jgi:hypothetical protein
LGGEEEGGVGDLLSFLEEQGAAPNGDPRRQPWRWSSVTRNVYVRKRERDRARERGKREGGQGRERGGVMAFLGSSRRSTGKQEVASAVARSKPRSSSMFSTKKTTDPFAKSPLGIGGFSGMFKQN